MRKLLAKFIVLLVIVIAFDWTYGKFACYLIDNAKGGEIYQDRYICDSLKADVLIMGSSKARNQYDPKILGDTLGLNIYNCGKSGMGIIFNYGRWKIISRRYTPKVIIYEVLPIVDLMVRDDNSIFINQLRPYYGKVEGIDSIFWTIDHNEKYKMLSKTYQYHSILDYINCYRDRTFLKDGYCRPGNDILDPTTVNYEDFEYELDSVKCHFMETFFTEVTSKTQLIIAISPMYSFHNDHGGLTFLKGLCKKYNVPILDHFCDPNFVDNPNLYIDMAHLNREGSIRWSKLIASELKPILNTQRK